MDHGGGRTCITDAAIIVEMDPKPGRLIRKAPGHVCVAK